MKAKLHILLLEDNLNDVKQIERELTKNNLDYELDYVDNEESFVKKILEIKPTIILSDYMLPQYSGLKALMAAKKISPDTPFIIVTGSMNEETAVECIKAGADDYIIKEHLARLTPAIKAAIEKYKVIKEKTKAESELRESDAKYRKFFEEDLAGDFITTPDGKIILCNPVFAHIFGFNSVEEVLNMPASILYVSDVDRKNFLDLLKEKKKLINYEEELTRKDGKKIYVIENAIGKFDESGKLIEITGYIIDNTERKLALEEIKTLSRSVEQSPVSIMIADPAGNLEYVNPKFTEQTGYTFEEVRGKNPRFLKSGYHNEDFYEKLWGIILSGKDFHGEMLNKKKNGELYWENAIISPIVNEKGAITQFVAIKEDITAKKKMIEDLISAKEKAEEMNRVKSYFLNNISHELRTPLIGILNIGEILRDEIIDDEQKSLADMMLKSGLRLKNTLQLLLDLADLEAHKSELSIKEIDLFETCEALTAGFKKEADAKGLKIDCNIENNEAMVLADGVYIEKILTQLIDNSIKYTKTGYVKVEILTGKDKWHIIRVVDTGTGIPKENLSKIFEPFRQASEGYSRSYEGLGIGLTLVKKYVELLDGEIEIKSEVGIGTTIEIKLPKLSDIRNEAGITEKKELVVKEEERIEIDNPKLLFLDDDSISILTYERMLKGKYNCDFYKKNNDALENAGKKPYDIIFLDINLGEPFINGTDVLRQMNKIPHLRNAKYVALTAYGSKKDQIYFLDKGFSYHLTKPFRKEELINLIEKISKNK